MKSFLPLMTHEEAGVAIDRGATAILPIGTVECNGPAVPLGLDYLISEALAIGLVDRFDAIRLPSISVGVSGPLSSFPGTLHITPEQLSAQVESILMSLIQSGWTRILLVNNHLLNQYPVNLACGRVRQKTGVVVPSVFPWSLIEDLCGDLYDGLEHTMGHGAEPGVSIMLHLHPESVNLDAAHAFEGKDFVGFTASPLSLRYDGSSIDVALDLVDVTDSGLVGDLTHASAERGNEIMKRMTDFVVSFLEAFDFEAAAKSRGKSPSS